MWKFEKTSTFQEIRNLWIKMLKNSVKLKSYKKIWTTDVTPNYLISFLTHIQKFEIHHLFEQEKLQRNSSSHFVHIVKFSDVYWLCLDAFFNYSTLPTSWCCNLFYWKIEFWAEIYFGESFLNKNDWTFYNPFWLQNMLRWPENTHWKLSRFLVIL